MFIVEKDYCRERLTKSERELVETMPHTLNDVLRQERANIMKRETGIDLFWGFFDDSKWASFKRAVYKKLVHRFLKKT